MTRCATLALLHPHWAIPQRHGRVLAMLALTSLLAFHPTSASPFRSDEFLSKRLIVKGVEREYLLYEPGRRSGTGDLRPLVIVLHGGGGTARYAATETGKTFKALADVEGFYLAFPNAINKMWDFGVGETSERLSQRADDGAFFAILLDTLIAQYPIDPRRIFATGISRGGQASYFMACTLAVRIRAIASVAMPLPRFMEPMCANTGPLGVAVINGTRDPLVPYDGGQIQVGGQKRGEVLSTDGTIDYWRVRNRCGDQQSGFERIDRVDDGMHVEKSTWSDCRGAPVVLYRIVGGGHTWPSGTQYLPAWYVGKVARDIDGAAEIWGFFRQFK